jgi:signal transduction histidine kinase
MNRPRSLRTRLLVAGAAGIAFASAIASLLLGAAFERFAFDAFERRLADDLLTVAGLVASDGDAGFRLRREPADARFARVFSGHYWRVGDGDAAQHSRSLWDHPLPLAAPPSDGELRFGSMPGPLGQQLRTAERMIVPAGATNAVRIWVASDERPLREDIARFRWIAGASVAFLAGLLLLAGVVQVGYGLRPLRSIAAAISRVESGEPGHIDGATAPAEIRPLLEQLDRLLARHAALVRHGRAASQDLAHALKTPLAALDAEAQRPGPELPRVVATQVARMRAVIERELAAARPADTARRVPIAPAVDRLVALFGRIHADRGLGYQVDVPADLCFRGAVEDLEEMLGNLLDNASKWACARVRISARVAPGGGLEIAIADDGPGMSESERAIARGRGQRLDEQVPGDGLGLDIVARIAAAHGGSLDLGVAPEGGLLARLRF